MILRARIQQGRQGRLPQRLEGLGVAEEVRDADEQLLEQDVDLVRVLLQVADILHRAFDLVQVHPPLDAPPDGVGLVAGEVVARARAQQDENLLHRLR